MRNAYLQMCDYGSRFRILKGGKISLVVSAFIAGTTLLHAAPSGGVVTSGNASIAQSGSVTNINQSSQKAAINWNSFSIAPSETVNFIQPSVSSVTLNRVIGNEKSIIEGALNANGQVFILNSNGVLFTKNASINTAGLVATTMNLSDADFMNGNYAFKGDSTASIINQGTITISDKGYAALFGKEVKNEGVIKATLGKVELVGAKEVTLNLNGNSLVNLKVDKGVLDALVENKGAIYADGGEVYLTTNAVNELLKGVVNNTGVIEANSIGDITSKVELFAHGGTAKVGGTIQAQGGFVETSGNVLSVEKGTTIHAGQWLIDPLNVIIDDAMAWTLMFQLSGGDATVTTSGVGADAGDITVNANFGWNTHTLTLNADRNIYINSVISVGWEGRLVLNYGQGAAAAGNTASYTFGDDFYASGSFKGAIDLINSVFETKQGSDGTLINWTIINALGSAGDELTGANTLQGLGHSSKLGGHYVLGATIDASDTGWGWNENAGFKPIENTGFFDGLGHSINNLFIDRPTENFVGLFGDNYGTIRNVALGAATITGASQTGGLVGRNDRTISHAHIASYNGDGSSVHGARETGGLVGLNDGTISDSSAAASVTGDDALTGGLAGHSSGGTTIFNSWAKGVVTGIASVGGLVGTLDSATISSSWAFVNVTGTEDAIGGLVGLVVGGTSSISDSYAAGSVTGRDYVGGLVGLHAAGAINRTYSTGLVTGRDHVGGLFGSATGTVSNSFWDTDTSGQATSAAGTGKTTAQMNDIATFTAAGWDIAAQDSNNPYPSLSMGKGATVWTIPVAGGTPTPDPEPTPTPTPDPEPTPTPDPEPQSTPTPAVVVATTPDVAHIVNNNAIAVHVPSFTPPAPPVQAPQQFSFGGQAVELMSTPTNAGETPTKIVSLSDVKEMQSEKGSANGGNNEVRVPLMAGSLIDLVNGGVKLPAGVEQEFFMAQK